MRYWGVFEWLAAILAAATVAGGAAVVVFEIQHPCVRYSDHRRSCETSVCTFTDPTSHMCMAWSTSEYDCTECLERKP